MHTDQQTRAQQALRDRGLDRVLFANPYTVTWLTGFAPPLQTGASPFAGGPPLVWYDGGQFTLLVPDVYDTVGISVPVVRYPGYNVETTIRAADNLATIVRDLVGRAGTSVGVEARHLPAALQPAGSTPVDGWLDPLRMVKDAQEITLLRRAFALGDLAHRAARTATRAGAREIDVWVALHSAVQQAAGQRVPMGNDCVVSYRENNLGGWPGGHALRPGDSLMVDLSVRLEGYWSDSCATYYATAPDARQTSMHHVAAQALALAISLIKPGAVAGEIDRQLKEFIVASGYPPYPHHSGHAVGVSAHEAPRIVPNNPAQLQTGMVLMLEPGIYFPRQAAVRLEDAVLVTADGCEVLTHHDKSLPD